MNLAKSYLFVLLVFLVGCSSVQESENENSTEAQSVYVFDDVTSDSVATSVAETNEAMPEQETNSTFEFFIVQLGAFSTLDKAQTFVNNTKNKTDYDLNIHFSEKVNFHVVQLPPFRSRAKAEEVRDKLKTIPEFNGAFIVPNNK